MATEIPANYGKRLMPQLLDRTALDHPNRILYSVALFENGRRDFQHITALTLARAVDKTAGWLRSQIGETRSIQPVGYIGPQASSCNIWVAPSESSVPPLITQILTQRSMKVLQLPEVEDLLAVDHSDYFPYTKTFEEAAHEPFCMLHTSGTTGVPKPISWSNGLIGTMDAVRLLPPTEGDDGLAPWTSMWQECSTIYSAFPMSHGAGIIMNILMPSLYNLRCVLGPTDVLPNINLIDSLADNVKIDIWSMVPSLVDELGETPDVLAKLNSSSFICSSGGPISQHAASKVNNVIRILNLTGTTEGLFMGNLTVHREDWYWFAFHPYSGFDFKEVEPGIYEHHIKRNKYWSLSQGIFWTFPGQDVINLKDLYIKHPTKPNLWAFKGRSDDVVVLSNGTKVSPLSLESYISTHPAVEGCLVIGTGKSQAGLLIELKVSTQKDNELFDSIWAVVELANGLLLQKAHLSRSYIAFADPDRPFIRTDKRTIKRHATVALYADYIDRFYESREGEFDTVAIDASSVETILESLRPIFGPSLPAVYEASPNTDIFSLGLDSHLVIRSVNAIRATMRLGDKLAPRHLYANPTLVGFATFLKQLTVEKQVKSPQRLDDEAHDKSSELKKQIDQHKARLSFKLNPLDYVNSNHYMGMNLYLPLREGMCFEKCFKQLQEGLRRALQLIPALDGKIMLCAEQEMGHKKGDLRLTIPPVLSSTAVPRQLNFKNLSDVLPPYDHLKAAGFLPSAVPDDLVLPCNPFPDYPADILVAQANFINKGCILAVNLHHSCLDGAGAIIALKVWAESCRYIVGDTSATCSWLDSECFNHSLPEILHGLDGYTKRLENVDPGVWGFLPFLRPEGFPSSRHEGPDKTKTLPVPPVWPYKLTWPPVPDAAGRSLKTTMFLITAKKLRQLQQKAVGDPTVKGSISLSDIIQAFFWRVAVRARFRVATEMRGQKLDSNGIAILELPIDGHPYFSSLLPSTYMGSMLILNRPSMSVETLCSPHTSIGHIASVLREAAARVTPSLIHDAFTLLQNLPEYDNFSLADMGLDGMHAMISNMMLFQPNEISFGKDVFGNDGSPEALRPQIERGSKRFRFLVIHPMRRDGGIELVLGTLPEELKMLKADDELLESTEARMHGIANQGDRKDIPTNNLSSHLDPEREEDGDRDGILSQAQAGVQDIEAVTTVWTSTALVVAYILIWITYFVEGMLSGTQTALVPYVTSSFGEHSLTPVVGIVSTVIGGCANFTIAKILDVFGRPQGYLICTVIATIGLIMMATCRHIEAYAAAQVFYAVGNNGLQYTLSVFVADTSSLRNRGLMQAFAYSPNMITCWLAGPISTAFLDSSGWPWAFGMFSILVPAVTLPLFALLQYHHFKAKKQDVTPKRKSGRTFLQSSYHYCREFDAVGLILLSAGVAMFLLPFNLYTLQADGWASPLIICLVVFGIVLLISFVLWEKFFAPLTFIPYALLTDRTVLGACFLSTALFFNYFCWSSYFSSYLQVVNDLSVSHTSYVVQIYPVGSTLFSLVGGLVIRQTGRFKPVCLYFGIPLSLFGTALMIYFRHPNSDVGYLVMCQIFISFAAGVIITSDEIAILAAASHQFVAASLATLGFFGNIGGAIGLTVTAAIWQKVFPEKLAEYLPASELPKLPMIYEDIVTQLSYREGSAARLAIQHAYGDAQRNILVTATAIWALGVVAVLCWRDINVSNIKQVRGHVV
ncbi:hypothetical protein K461DRAFT_310975 [Myriangium duriaei CBS 260.36]|uniref:Major facilitator superfamily (MFS) profile domain-containing protein n=1 Tax=Myriangium duriaei CBS 260.36 TaxID=1168546 RepID=A0A9P4MIQ1_9PEZI|nr:hypothetical protein K461DRAFT_310975 [Myriangium duriaei CBS 260.36]